MAGKPLAAGEPDTLVVESTRQLFSSSVYGDWLGRPRLLDDGTKWICAYRVGASHSAGALDRVCIRFSTDEGATWTDENVFTDGNPVSGAPLYLDPQYVAGPDAICKAPNGDLLIFVPHGGGYGGTHVWRSTDSGASWADDGSIGPYNTDTVPNVLVLGSDIYAVCYAGGYNCDLAKSSDNGLNWSLVEHVVVEADGFNTNEYSLSNPSGSKFLVVMRNYDSIHTYQKISRDLGLNWDPATTSDEIGIIHRPITAMFDAIRVYLVGRDYANGASHEKTIICYSDDGGSNWVARTELQTSDQFDCGYADMLMRTDGTIYIVDYIGTYDYAAATIYEYIVSVTPV